MCFSITDEKQVYSRVSTSSFFSNLSSFHLNLFSTENLFIFPIFCCKMLYLMVVKEFDVNVLEA